MSPRSSIQARRLAVGASFVALSLAFGTGASRAGDPEPPALDDATIAIVTTKVASEPATVRHFTMSTRRDTDLPNDRTIQTEILTEHVLLESGLWGTSTEASTTGAVSGSGTSTSLQLCGLVELLQTSRSHQEVATKLPLPIGKLFVPFGIVDTHDIQSSRRVSSFASDESSLCSPRPGSRFEYQVTTEAIAELRFRTVRNSTARRVTCIVADHPEPLDDRVRGVGDQYLPVACETAGAAHSLTHLAWLPSIRYYVVLDASEARLRERHVLTTE